MDVRDRATDGQDVQMRRPPTLFQLQVQYYPIRPDVAGPKWNIQLQATPTIPALIKRALF